MAELSAKLLVELSVKLLAELSEVNGDFVWYIFRVGRGVLDWYTLVFIWYTFRVRWEVLEWYTFILFGIHSGSEEECSNDICLFLFGIHSGSEGECSNDIRMFCMVYIRGQKESARIVYSQEYDWVISVYYHVWWTIWSYDKCITKSVQRCDDT